MMGLDGMAAGLSKQVWAAWDFRGQDGISALIMGEETPDSSLFHFLTSSLPIPWAHSEEEALCKPRKEPVIELDYAAA